MRGFLVVFLVLSGASLVCIGLSDPFIDAGVLEPYSYVDGSYIYYRNSRVSYEREYNLTGSTIVLEYNVSWLVRSNVDSNWRSIVINVSIILYGSNISITGYNGTIKTYGDHVIVYYYYFNATPGENESPSLPNPYNDSRHIIINITISNPDNVEAMKIIIYSQARSCIGPEQNGEAKITNATYKLVIFNPQYTNTTIIPIPTPHWNIDIETFITGFLGGVIGALITLLLIIAPRKQRLIR